MIYPYLEKERVDVLPVSLAYAKSYLHIDAANTAHDATITRMIKAARDFFEGATNNSLTEITYNTYRDFFIPCYEIRKTPLSTIESVKYRDSDGVLQTIDNADYYIQSAVGYDFLVFKEAFVVPSVSSDFGWPIDIEFKSGFTSEVDAIPEDIADALLAHIAKLFKNRGDDYEFSGGVSITRRYVPRTTWLAIMKYKVVEIGA